MRISDWSSDVCSSDLTQCVLWRPQIYASVVVVQPSVGRSGRPTGMVTVAPSGAVEFADGLVAVTRPSSLWSAVSSSETVTLKPSPCSVAMALASERPTTEGTVDSAGPLDTTMVIWAPLGWGVSAGGSVRMTWPSGTDAEDSVVWVTVKPFWPRMFDASVTLRPATFGTPRP